MRILYVSAGGRDGYLLAALREAGHVLEIAAESQDGPSMASEGDFDAVILDWPRPPEGWLRRFSEAGALVVVSGAGDARERARVLRAGADACFVRPFAFAELEARLQALRRTGRKAEAPASASDLELAEGARAVRHGEAEIILSALEFRMLSLLVERAGEVISISALRRMAWGDDAEPAPEPVHQCATRLRRKLASIGAGGAIEAIPGHGYVFRPRPVAASAPLAI